MSNWKDKKILFAVTGSIAAIKAALLVSRLVQEGAQVQVVLSPSGKKFVGEATWEGLTGRSCYVDSFQPGEMMSHIHLARWCDLMIICPATANTLNALNAGTLSEPLGSLYLALEDSRPLFIVPAMNSQMWSHPSVVRSRQDLEMRSGHFLIEPSDGTLACGEVGTGKLPEPDQILKEISNCLANLKSKKSKGRLLITAGGSREYIDGVRCITNNSTGQSGLALAKAFEQIGWQVDLVLSKFAQGYDPSLHPDSFITSSDLSQALEKKIQIANTSGHAYQAVFQMAAISDYLVDQLDVDGRNQSPSADHKIPSGESLGIHLKKAPKIIDSLKTWLSNDQKLIAFKLTKNLNLAQTQSHIDNLFSHSQADYVVWNDLSEYGKDSSKRPFVINAKQKQTISLDSIEELAKQFDKILILELKNRGQVTSGLEAGVKL